jgi:acyl carrier protein
MSAASTRITTAADLGQFIGGVCLDALMDDVLDPLEQALVRYIDEELVDADRRGEVDEETELLLDEYIDSINVVHLVIFIRERCGCEVPPEDITIDHFGTVRDLAGYLCRRDVAA